MNSAEQNSTSTSEILPPTADPDTGDLFLPADDDRPLESVAADINAAHLEAQRYAAKAVDRALTAGDLLLTVKARLPHGVLSAWCAEHLPAITQRQLQKYMKVARELPIEKRTGSFLSLNDALRLVADDAEPESLPLLSTVESNRLAELETVIAANLPEALARIDDLPAYHDQIIAPVLPATPALPVSAATVAAMLAELPQAEQRTVLDTTAAAADLKVVRADAKYLHTSQKRHEWYTPAEYIEAARTVMGGIDLDPASCEMAQSTVKATRFFTKEQDGLAQPWQGRVWMNPPFESELIRPFVTKLLSEFHAGTVEQAIVLTDNATDTSWFHDLADTALAFCFTRGRIKFQSPLSDSQAPQRGQVFTYLGRCEKGFKRFKERFADIGLVVVEAQP